jgi:hypothetical protein
MIKDCVPVVRAVIDALLLLEFAGPEEIDPDTAVRGMENIASSLKALDEGDQQELRAHLLQIAEESDDAAFSKFVRSLPEMLGLAPGR